MPPSRVTYVSFFTTTRIIAAEAETARLEEELERKKAEEARKSMEEEVRPYQIVVVSTMVSNDSSREFFSENVLHPLPVQDSANTKAERFVAIGVVENSC